MFGRNQAQEKPAVQMEDLSAFADGALSPSRARVVAEHLRRHRDSADVVYQYWCQDAELMGSFSGLDDETSAARDSELPPRLRNPDLGWFRAVAASVLFVSGIVVGGASDLIPGLGEAPASTSGDDGVGGPLVEMAPAVPQKQAVAPITVSDAGEIPALQQEGAPVPPKPSVATLSNEPALSLPEPDMLPKSQLSPPPQSRTFHFTGADGVQLTLIKSRLASAVDETAIEAPSIGGTDEVRWIQGENVLTLTGNLDPAGLLLVAMKLQTQNAGNGTGAAGAGLQATPGTTAEQPTATTESASVRSEAPLHSL
ncbi:hypothetical protein [Microbulbifer sp.]|uniref:anti-sigma factor family protein n=1 Tax=Microbulbifer sp. TaxID=1908541 RepID=UPI00258EF3ED|nr:hypothetical protein [Microbulbifer sp.]